MLGASVVQAEAADDGKSHEEQLKKKHEALEGQAKAERVQAEQMHELKQIQKQRQAAEAQADKAVADKAVPTKAVADKAAPETPPAGKSDAKAASPGPLLRRGGQLPDALASDKALWVEDWQRHQLPEPGEGQRWLQLRSGFVLTDIQSGTIEEILLGP
ncbi:RcnB family protein [Cobetia sp. 3AK]|uniref:RcnB family protein n=1 Tax=Cobetia sp. 3AK TaxID=3040020 RepID=UPI00244A3637|nr:RcnB family protein [Cobetia sp. 3AK]MDH2374648.1 RcnB family protein [Cobetia sp. 3AK]